MDSKEIINKEKDFYNSFASQYEDKWLSLPEWQPLLKQENDILDKYLNQPGDLVDIGCGTGRTVIPFALKGFRCTGIDISESMLKIARNKAKQQNLSINFLCQDVVDSPLPTSSYNYALVIFDMLSIIPGDENRIKLLNNLCQSLRPKGLLFSSVWTYPKTMDVILNEEGTLLPSRFWKTQDLIDLIERCGFVNIQTLPASLPNHCREICDYVLFTTFVFRRS
jgi:SAM-dependent methyltransferase